MTKVTKDEFFKIVGNDYVMNTVNDIPISIFYDENQNVIGKATWTYPETIYELA